MAVHLDLDTLVIHPLDELFNVMHFNYQSNAGREARIRLVNEGLVASTYLNRRVTGNPSSSSSSSSNNANGDDATTAILSKEHNDTAIYHKLLANVTVNAFFTKDYNMIVPGSQQQRVGVQGGFLLIRPSITTYLKLINTVYSGEFYSGFNAQSTGWLRGEEWARVCRRRWKQKEQEKHDDDHDDEDDMSDGDNEVPLAIHQRQIERAMMTMVYS